MFLKQSTCYAITPDTHQWYRINTNETTDNNKIALCYDPTVQMVPLPSAEPSSVNTFKRIARLIFHKLKRDHPKKTHTQPIHSKSTLTNNNTNSSPQNNKNNNVHPHDQSTVILKQFSMITQELRNFTDKVSDDITKTTQACIAAQENTGKLIENVISQALMKPQDVTPLIPQ